MIPISHPLIGEEEKNAVLEVLGSGHLAQGQKVRDFENRFAEWCGAKHAVAANSGTSALHMALLAHGIGAGDEVITSPFSFVASANCALYVGARPVFADIEPDFFTLDPQSVAERVTSRTRAIIPVHLFGQPCDMGALQDVANEHDLLIIEDACQAHGARWHGHPIGSSGTCCYSFYPTKNMTTIEGGMLTTPDPQIAEKARLIRDHGSPQRYSHVILGYNFRMTEVEAAIGLVQLAKLDAWNTQRQANARFVTDHLSLVDGVSTPRVRAGATHVFHQYTIRVNDRDRRVETLRDAGVGVGVYYPVPIHQQPVYRDLGYVDCLPNAEKACREVLSLPVHPALTQADLEYIVDIVSIS
jgi:perosamine synthetase